MPLKLRILLILVIAVFTPLMVCILVIATSSYKNNVATSAEYHLSRAEEMSRGIEDSIRNHGSLTHQIVSKSSDFRNLLSSSQRKNSYTGWINSKDNWDQFNDLSPELTWLVKGPAQLRFQKLKHADRSLESYIITDRNGYPLHASTKPTQFEQFETDWWQAIHSNPASTVIVRTVETANSSYDRLEILGCLSPESNPEEVQGYLRLVVRTQPILDEFFKSAVWQDYQGILASEDGTILLRQGELFSSTTNRKIPSKLIEQLIKNRSSAHTQESTVIKGEEMILAATLSDGSSTSLSPAFISISGQSRASAILPLQETHQRQLFITLGVIFLSLIAGFFYMRKTISKPIEQIRSVTKTVKSVAQENALLRRGGATELVAPLSDIHTGDEIEGLAKEFSGMARKVLGFQRRLEEEVETKTQTIQEDLEMAKEFQQALLPTNYPEVELKRETSVSLEFAHSYRPAAVVSGDFFDIVKIDPFRYAIFIGDVMGHGARSALVTAILRALVEDTCLSKPQPHEFMAELNRRFCEIIERSHQTVFVTAAYLLFDTRASSISVCSAGHPCPLIVKAKSGSAKQMISHMNGALPLGLYSAVEYESKEFSMNVDDLILLYTDGITEAENKDKEQYGEERLTKQLSKFSPLEITHVAQALEASVMQYANGKLDDDFCMLLIRIVNSSVPSDPTTTPTAKASANSI